MTATVRVLVIADDSMRTAEIVSRQLARVGLGAVTSFAASEGEYQRHLMVGVDVVIWQHGHARISASQALAIPRNRHLDVPVLAIARSIGGEAIVEHMRMGIADVIRREPYARLGPAVERALAERDERIAQRSTEAALRYSETRFRMIASIMSDFAYVLRVTDGGTLAWEWTTETPDRIKNLRLEDLPDRNGWTASSLGTAPSASCAITRGPHQMTGVCSSTARSKM